MNSFDLATARLRLVSITGEMMDACTDTERLAYLLSAEVPASWPPEHWEPHVYGFIKEQVAKHPHTAGWNRFVLLHGERSTLIGTICGFPRTPSEAEIGYSLLEAWQRQGYATEGVRAFVAAMLRDDTVQSITAQTFPQLSAPSECCAGAASSWSGQETKKAAYGTDCSGARQLKTALKATSDPPAWLDTSRLAKPSTSREVPTSLLLLPRDRAPRPPGLPLCRQPVRTHRSGQPCWRSRLGSR